MSKTFLAVLWETQNLRPTPRGVLPPPPPRTELDPGPPVLGTLLLSVPVPLLAPTFKLEQHWGTPSGRNMGQGRGQISE